MSPSPEHAPDLNDTTMETSSIASGSSYKTPEGANGGMDILENATNGERPIF